MATLGIYEPCEGDVICATVPLKKTPKRQKWSSALENEKENSIVDTVSWIMPFLSAMPDFNLDMIEAVVQVAVLAHQAAAAIALICPATLVPGHVLTEMVRDCIQMMIISSGGTMTMITLAPMGAKGARARGVAKEAKAVRAAKAAKAAKEAREARE